MTKIKSSFAFKALSILIALVLCFAFLPTAAFAAYANPTISIRSNSDTEDVYVAVKIADSTSRPVTDNFNWQKLLNESDDLSATSVSASLVNEVSKKIEELESPDYNAWVASFADKSNYDYMIAVNDGPVSVVPGWYIAFCGDKQPIFAYATNSDVEVWEKIDAPYHEHYVSHQGNWGERAIYGAFSTIPYKVEISIPKSISDFDIYPMSLAMDWDENLIYDEGSLNIYVQRDILTSSILCDVAYADETVDVSEAHTNTSMIINFSDVKKYNVGYGDKIVVDYTMHMAADAPTGTTPMTTMSYVTYPTSIKDLSLTDTTPIQTAHVHSFKLVIKKIDSDTNDVLSDARFIVRDGNNYMKQDGTFEEGVENAAQFVTGDNGEIRNMPVLGLGSYELIEVEAPQGYELPKIASYLVTIAADIDSSTLGMKVSATNGALVESVDGTSGIATIVVPNSHELSDVNVGGPGDLPITGGDTVGNPTNNNWWDDLLTGTGLAHTGLAQTGDILLGIIILLVIAGVSALMVINVKRRKNKSLEN